jgi:thiol:disulfide interchange protein
MCYIKTYGKTSSFSHCLWVNLVTVTCGKKSTNPDPDDDTTASDPIEWVSTAFIYDTGLEKNPLSLLFFYTDWCHWCHEMENKTFSDSTVAAIIEASYNAVKVNPEADSLVVYFDTTISCSDLAREYEVRGIPHTCVFDFEGRLLGAIRGYRSTGEFITMLQYLRDNPPEE